MTNLPPSDPRSSQRNSLDFDDFIGILVAFVTIGSIIFWSFSRRETGWNFTQILPSLSPTTSPVAQPSLQPNLQPTPQAPTLIIPPLVVTPEKQPDSNIKTDTLVIPTPKVEEPKEIPSVPGAGVFGFVPPVVSSVPTPLASPKPFQVTTPVAKMPIIPPPRAFTDVPDNFWGRRFIDVLSSRKIIEGFKDYSFRPNQAITRAEFAAILERAFNKEIGQTKLDFKDIPQKYWATGAINDAIATGFLKGYPDKTFKPDQKIPRVQVLVALVSGLNLKTPSAPDKIVGVYKDSKDIPKYAIEKIAAATTDGLVVNYPDKQTFAPKREATRAEVAAMIHQALVRTGRLQPIQSENIVRIK
jgi:S-layer homology domain